MPRPPPAGPLRVVVGLDKHNNRNRGARRQPNYIRFDRNREVVNGGGGSGGGGGQGRDVTRRLTSLCSDNSGVQAHIASQALREQTVVSALSVVLEYSTSCAQGGGGGLFGLLSLLDMFACAMVSSKLNSLVKRILLQQQQQRLRHYHQHQQKHQELIMFETPCLFRHARLYTRDEAYWKWLAEEVAGFGAFLPELRAYLRRTQLEERVIPCRLIWNLNIS